MDKSTDLKFGDYVYLVNDLTMADIVENSVDYETIAFEHDSACRFIAYHRDEGYAILLLEPNTVIRIDLRYVNTKPPTSEGGYKCPICSEFNPLEIAREACRGCGVPYDPLDGTIGDGNQEEEAPF